MGVLLSEWLMGCLRPGLKIKIILDATHLVGSYVMVGLLGLFGPLYKCCYQ